MSSKIYMPNEDKPKSHWGVNKNINSEHQDKFREQQTKWHPSKLDGYVSDEFRNIEFAD